MPADVNLNIDIEKKGDGDKSAALGLELVAKAADNAKDELAQLDRKLIETRAAMVAAGKDFAATGNVSPFKSLLKDERQLSQVKKTLERLTEDVKTDLGNAGEQGGKGFIARLQTQLGSGLGAVSGAAPTGLVPWLVGAAVLASPAIGAAINAGVLLGVGGGTLALGIISQVKDPAVSAAFKDLGSEVKADLAGASAQFRDPLIQAAHTFSDVWNKEVRPGLAQDFNALAPSIDHLSAGVGNFARNIMPGFNQAVTASAPILNQLGDDTLPRMGEAIGQFFDAISQGGPGAEQFLRDFTTLADLSVKQLGGVTLALSKTYDSMRNGQLAASGLAGTFPILTTLLEKLDGGSKQASTSFQMLGSAQAIAATQAHQAAVNEQELATAMAKVDQLTKNALGNQLTLAQANLGVSQSFQSLKDSVNSHGKSLKDNTADGIANRQAILGGVSALAQQRDAAIAAAGGVNASKSAVDAANAAYDRGVGALLDLAAKLGLSSGEAQALAGSLRSIPNIERTVTIDYLVRTTHKDVYIGGASPYQQSANALLGAYGYGGIIPAAARGLIAAGPVLLGERTVPEAAIPAPNSGISQGKADMLLGTAASWWGRKLMPASGGGGRNLTVNVYAGWGANGAEIGQQVAQVISRQIRTDPAFAATIAGAST